MHRYLLLIVFCLAQLISFGQRSTKPPLTLFSVGDNPVSADEFLYVFRKNHQNKPEEFTDEKVKEYLDLFINFKLKVAEARARGLDTTRKFTDEFNTYREELKKPYRTEPNALDQLTRETYQRLTEEVKASHILISLKADALPADTLIAHQKVLDIRNRVQAGEDFEKLARELSEDPSAKYNGGNLGFFTAMQMVFPFEEAAYQTKVGELSGIVRTRFGYHLLKVEDRKPARGEVEVSHILLRAGSPDDAKVKDKIFSIHSQLKAGGKWDELCEEHSEDTNTKSAGGRLKPFGVGALASVPEFETMAFSMKEAGQISDPFQSAVGWHIIRLEKKIPLPTFSEMEESLKRRVARDERLQLSQLALKERRRKEYSWQEVSAVKDQIIGLADSSLSLGKWKYTGSPAWKSEKLMSLSGASYTVGDFIGYVEKNQVRTTAAPTPYLKQLYEGFVEEKILQAEEAKLISENPEFKNLLTEYREGILFFDIMEKEVWNRASEDSTGQRNFYEERKANYQAGDRIEARVFTAQQKGVITEVMKKITAGDTLRDEDIKKFKSIQNFRNFEKGDSKVIDRISWTIGLHEVDMDGLFYLVEVKQLVPTGVKSFEEARASIISDYQDYLEKQWIIDLKKKFTVKVNKKGRKYVLAQLKTK